MGSFWRRITNSRYFCLGTSGIFIFILILILSTIHHLNRTACKDDLERNPSAEYLSRQASILHSYVNLSVDPCQDFYEFTCGGLKLKGHKKYDISWKESSTQKSIEPFEVFFQKHLTSPIMPSDSNALRVAKQFYLDCSNTDAIERQGLEPLVNILNAYGGWPAATENWNVTNFDVRDIIADSNSKFYHFLSQSGLLIDISATEIYHMFNKTVREKYIRIDQPKFVLPPLNFLDPALQTKTVQSSINYFVDLATAFANWTGAKVSTESLKIQAEEVLAFESKLVNMSSSDDERRKRRNYSLFNHNRMTISEFQNLTDTAVEVTSKIHYNLNWNWTNLIQNVFKGSNITITSDEIVEAHEIRYTLDLLDIIACTEPRIVANYCIWRLATALVRYTTTKMRELVKMHEKYDTSSLNMYESQNCLRIAFYDSLLRLPLSIKYMQTHFSEEMKIEASQIADNIKATFLKQIERSSSAEDFNWLDASSMLRVEKKIKNVTPVIGYPDWYTDKDQTFVESQFAQLNIQEGQYFQSLLKLSSFEMIQKYQNFKGVLHRNVRWKERPEEPFAFYDFNLNSIYIHAGLILKSEPKYDLQGLQYLNYGSLGFVMGHEFGHSVDPYNIVKDQNGVWQNYTSLSNYTARMDCFIEQYNNFKTSYGFVNGSRTVADNVADSIGVKLMFSAYQNWIMECHCGRKEEVQLPGFEKFTPEQMLFIAYGVNSCVDPTTEHLQGMFSMSAHSPNRFRVIGAAQNSEEFSKTWNCPSGSRMNPDERAQPRCGLL